MGQSFFLNNDMKQKIFINLTNGIEALPNLNADDIHFIRIQSSHCERQKYNQILDNIDFNFLMYLAMGYECIVYDYGANSEVPKAIYTGLEWIKYVCNRRWLNKEEQVFVKGKNVTEFYNKKYFEIEYKTKRKIDYFKKFLLTDELLIKSVCSETQNDNKIEFYQKIIQNLYK